MYFPKRYSKNEIIWIVRSIYKEQDKSSPHLYLPPDFQIYKNSIVIDAGVAEGNFALSVIENVKKIYLIECDPEWIEALKLTFNPWQDKVVIVSKFLSDTESETTTSIDTLLEIKENESYFIKMDIEGFEQKALLGMKKLSESGVPVKLDICTYHKSGDFLEIKEILKNIGYSFKGSDSYMLFYNQGNTPEFRKVLLRAWK